MSFYENANMRGSLKEEDPKEDPYESLGWIMRRVK
jgi:hypothetical protein